jgi:hypothetical protein
MPWTPLIKAERVAGARLVVELTQRGVDSGASVVS